MAQHGDGPDASLQPATELVGATPRLDATAGPVVAAVVTGLVARSRPNRWSIWMYILWVFLIGVALRVISTAGRLGGTG